MITYGKAGSAAALVGAGLLVSACGDDVEGMAAEAKALATIHVTLTGTLPPPAPDRPLRPRVSLVWAQASSFEDPFCAPFGYGMPPPPTLTELVERGCRDVLGFLPRAVGESVALGQDGKADLPVYFLPAANDMQGKPEGRLAYASVVVFDDRNGNGVLDLGRTQPWPGGGGQGGNGQGGGQGGNGPGGGEGGSGGGGMGQQVARAPNQKKLLDTDVVIAASFVTMRAPHERVALREGDANLDLLLRAFYPTPGCAAPPKYLSRVQVQDPLEFDIGKLLEILKGKAPATADPFALFKPVRCQAEPLDGAAVALSVQPTDVVGQVRCRADKPPTWAADPDKIKDDPRKKVPTPASFCLDANHLALVNDGPCKGITHYFLRGCNGQYECPKNKQTGKPKKPDYDFSAPEKQPKWWPCGTPKPWVP